MTDTRPDDADITRRRSMRFGELPGRVHPDAAIEMVETGRPDERPGAAGTEEQRQVFLAGG